MGFWRKFFPWKIKFPHWGKKRVIFWFQFRNLLFWKWWSIFRCLFSMVWFPVFFQKKILKGPKLSDTEFSGVRRCEGNGLQKWPKNFWVMIVFSRINPPLFYCPNGNVSLWFSGEFVAPLCCRCTIYVYVPSVFLCFYIINALGAHQQDDMIFSYIPINDLRFTSSWPNTW